MSKPNISEGLKTAGAALTLIERIAGFIASLRRTDAEKAKQKRKRATDLRNDARSALTLRGRQRKLDRAAELEQEANALAPLPVE